MCLANEKDTFHYIMDTFHKCVRVGTPRPLCLLATKRERAVTVGRTYIYVIALQIQGHVFLNLHC